MNYILFDPEDREALMPIAALRPISSIRIGAFTIKQKWEKHLNASCSVLPPQYLRDKFITDRDNENIFINATVLPTPELVNEILSLDKLESVITNDDLIAFRSANDHDEYNEGPVRAEIKQLKNTWDIISFLGDELQTDFSFLEKDFERPKVEPFTTIINEDNVFVGENVKLGACILNASTGKIFIDDEAEIMDGAILKGPIYIGKHTIVKMGAKLYGPIATGEECRVGGEVSDSVFQGFCNKGHDGFLGHSYIGEWCNLGADTNNSNLKNTYDKVRIWNYASGRFDKTGMQFLGLIMGDHAKTGINTMLNTGTVIGAASNVYGAGFPRNFVPDFSEGSSQRMNEFGLRNVYRMAKNMMARRNIEFTTEDEQIMAKVFERTSSFRRF